MSSQMVTLSVVMHCGVVGVLGEIVKFGCSLMRIVHGDRPRSNCTWWIPVDGVGESLGKGDSLYAIEPPGGYVLTFRVPAKGSMNRDGSAKSSTAAA